MTGPRSGRLVVFFTAALVLTAPAIWNGFPFVFADTGGYLARAHEHTLEIGRSALYGVFIAIAAPLAFWPAAVAQAALTVWVLFLTARVHDVRGPSVRAGIIVVLAVATSLPWFAGQLMPDIYAPLAALAIAMFAFRREYLRGWEIAGLVATVALAIAFHMATLALVLMLIACLIVWRGVTMLVHVRPMAKLALPAWATAAGLMLALVSNWLIAGQFAFTPGGANFVFGRLLQDGIVARYLSDRCPAPDIRLCAYRDQLPSGADEWLWGWGSPFYKLGGAEAYEPEARRIVLESITLYPGQHIVTALRATAAQLVRLRTGEGLHSGDNEHVVRAFARYVPKHMPAFMTSRQQQDAINFAWINAVHVPVALVSMLLLPIIVVLAWVGRVDADLGALAFAILMTIVLNAAISGVFSNPNDRYQSRVAWLAPLVLCIVVARHRAREKPA